MMIIYSFIQGKEIENYNNYDIIINKNKIKEHYLLHKL